MQMLDPRTTQRFIDNYKRFLLSVKQDEPDDDASTRIVERLVRSRTWLTAAPARLTEHLARAWEEEDYDEEILAAIETLQVSTWVYLRDTRQYSIFLSADGSVGYAVLSLTDRIRDLIGGSGVLMDTGIVRIGDRYVCDGLLSNVIILGPGYLKSYREAYAELQDTGEFHNPINPAAIKRNRQPTRRGFR